MHRILFICHGNICRSPMAEFILKALVKAKGLKDLYYIESAAVTGMGYLATKENYLYSKNENGMARVADNCFVYVANSTSSKKNKTKL